MDEKLFYCYEKLSENEKLSISEEEYVKSVELIEYFISEYNFKVSNPYRDNDAYYLAITDNNVEGYIKICLNYICVEIIKKYSSQIIGREYLYVLKDKFKGRLCNYVYNLSGTNVSINGKQLLVDGSLAITDFDNDGCMLNKEFIPYTTDNNIEKLNTALRANIECGKEILDNFLIYDELNIKSINFIDEGFEDGKGKIFN